MLTSVRPLEHLEVSPIIMVVQVKYKSEFLLFLFLVSSSNIGMTDFNTYPQFETLSKVETSVTCRIWEVKVCLVDILCFHLVTMCLTNPMDRVACKRRCKRFCK